MLYRLGKKSKKSLEKSALRTRLGAKGGGGEEGEVATKGKECHHQHFVNRRQFQAMHFLREVRDNIKRISHSRLVFATSVDGLAY